MKNKIKGISLLLPLILFFITCKKPETGSTVSCENSPTASHPKGGKFQQLIDAYVQKGIPGMSLLVSDSSGVWYGSGGKADIGNNVTYTPCIVQKLGSINKMMIGVLIMKLREEGVLNLDDMVSKYLDASQLKNIKNADKVTIRNCMQHTTGIFDIISSSDFYLAALHNPNKHWTGDELLEFLRNQPVDFEANTKAMYSNSNYLLLSMCIDKATGKEHGKLLHEKLFDPLGMQNTYYHTHDALPANTAQGYYDLYNNNTIVNVSNIITGDGNGFNGVYSNVFDLRKFVEGVFINKSIIKQSSLDTMMQWVKDAETANSDFGLGLFRKDDDKGADYRVGHTGGDLGYASEVYYFPRTNRFYILNVNYGTNGNSFLKPTYLQMVAELTELVKE